MPRKGQKAKRIILRSEDKKPIRGHHKTVEMLNWRP
jgi:hypothetical protein